MTGGKGQQDNKTRFPHLLSPLRLGGLELANRAVSTGHHTHLAHLTPNEALIAYHEARARAGVGLIVTEVTGVHATALFSNDLLMATEASCIPAFAALAGRIKAHGTKVFAQLFHPGRELLASSDGLLPVAYAPSAVPNERFHMTPRVLSGALIEEIVEGYARAAGFLAKAGYDGVEIVASHGYLPAQFLNPKTNLRDDAWGGDPGRRLAFTKAVAESVRQTAPELVLGLRISGDEMDEQGLGSEEILKVCGDLAGAFDYFSVVCGTSASLGGSVHIVPPMGIESGYTAPYAAAIRVATKKPVIATGRINQPQTAEAILATGQADLCGMTRALIADSQMLAKTKAGRLEEIRACIACNQSCIGRAHKGLGISCIQNPVSGRETLFAAPPAVTRSKRIAVVGGGPAGMKAAVTASQAGHQVTLFEAEPRLGGQVLLAERLPGREEFGGMATNLQAELVRSSIAVRTKTQVDLPLLQDLDVEAVILATGAKPYCPSFEGADLAKAVTAWEVIENPACVGARVAIADWRADWIGLGLAELLARAGAEVTLCTNAAQAGETLQIYTRNHYLARLHRLEVPIRTHARLFGFDGDTAYFQDTLTQAPILIESIDSLVLALGHAARSDLGEALEQAGLPYRAIGDCLAPRTAEEAIYEGYLAGREV